MMLHIMFALPEGPKWGWWSLIQGAGSRVTGKPHFVALGTGGACYAVLLTYPDQYTRRISTCYTGMLQWLPRHQAESAAVTHFYCRTGEWGPCCELVLIMPCSEWRRFSLGMVMLAQMMNLKSTSQKLLLHITEGPISKYSWFVIHMSLNIGREHKMEAPIQAPYLAYGEVTT